MILTLPHGSRQAHLCTFHHTLGTNVAVGTILVRNLELWMDNKTDVKAKLSDCIQANWGMPPMPPKTHVQDIVHTQKGHLCPGEQNCEGSDKIPSQITRERSVIPHREADKYPSASSVSGWLWNARTGIQEMIVNIRSPHMLLIRNISWHTCNRIFLPTWLLIQGKHTPCMKMHRSQKIWFLKKCLVHSIALTSFMDAGMPSSGHTSTCRSSSNGPYPLIMECEAGKEVTALVTNVQFPWWWSKQLIEKLTSLSIQASLRKAY